MQPEQQPTPDSQLLHWTGETLTITLTLPRPTPGYAFLRTNLGNLHLRQKVLIRAVEQKLSGQEADWQDLPMTCLNPRQFALTLPLSQVGYFQAKAFFVEKKSDQAFWPVGGNIRIKVEPAATWSGNTIYSAFIRQFGPNKNRPLANRKHQTTEKKLEAVGYTVIPPSGTFADLQQELDFIIGTLGFRIIQLLPIYPVPTTYARMGQFGSPFAPLDFFAVDPALAVFNTRQSPLEQFASLVEHIHARQARIFLDLPADHSGWSSTLQLQHPEWFLRYPDGTYQNPGAWGITWEDLCKFDFSQIGLWHELARVFLHWCRLGVDGFRCDAGYMIPFPVWQYIITKVRQQYPDTIFFLEGLGGKIEDTRTLLCEANHNWAYSELFQQVDQPAINGYLRFANDFSSRNGFLVHFAETHDNNRLAAVSPQWARQRTALAALTAPAGAFGITNGVEWLATEKINVHQAAALNWGSRRNLVEWITTLNRLLTTHPAFAANATFTAVDCPHAPQAGLFLRTPTPPDTPLLVIFNYCQEQETDVEWDTTVFAPKSTAYDCLTGRKIKISHQQQHCRIHLQAGECLCLATKPPAETPPANRQQIVKAWLTDLCVRRHGLTDCAEIDFTRLAHTFLTDPDAALTELPGNPTGLPQLEWIPERDASRRMPIPAGHLLTLRQNVPLQAEIIGAGQCLLRRTSVCLDDGTHFIFLPLTTENQPATLHVTLFHPDKPQHVQGEIIVIPAESTPIRLQLLHHEITPLHCGVCTNTNSAYALVRAAWGTLASQYDALLAANLNPAVPVEKNVLLTRCRAWIICHNFSRELKLDCQTAFAVLDSRTLQWDFSLPTVKGTQLLVHIRLLFDPDLNRLQLLFFRSDADSQTEHCPISLILRPDLDDRSHHTHTKAFNGPEKTFPAAVQPHPNGFCFATRSGSQLHLQSSNGAFLHDPEWTYQVNHAQDAERGLEAEGDLFSPGYFRCPLPDTTPVVLAIAALHADEPLPAPPQPKPIPSQTPQELPLEATLRQAMDQFMVRRDAFQTVIAGYPWFLDWGRDTLIVLRGMISAGKLDQARSSIGQFAAFEENGTLPNMIRGHDVSNRDTSDAPLWLFTAVNDLILYEKSTDLLELRCGKRTLLQVLRSIIDHYWHGTPNGIKACTKTALIYSPSHFTWMDTNYPACSPRQGYPIEIQALWIAALQLLNRHTGEKRYAEWAEQARNSLTTLFRAPLHVGLADCLLAEPGTPATAARADDACRPNQLLAITLGAITDPTLGHHILQAVQPLLIPGAIRSLANQPVTVPISVLDRGRQLNDPLNPYCGHYTGDEDTRRKPAYHNGTAWGWMMPSFSEALLLCNGEAAKPAARAWLYAVEPLLKQACLGQLPEINDGDTPHTPRGCPAQAWSVSEFLRVLLLCQPPTK